MASEAVTSRYRSRILREMNANRENPFNSPPSSTGSHGTVSPTMSSVFSDPDGESTRKLNEEIARVTGPRSGKFQVNWEAAQRKWPEFYGAPSRKNNNNNNHHAATNYGAAHTKSTKPARENVQPKMNVKFQDDDDSTHEIWHDHRRSRAEMQARVDNESDLSSNISQSPARFNFNKMTSVAHLTNEQRAQSPLSRGHGRLSSGYQHHQQQQLISSPKQRMNQLLPRSQTSPSLKHTEDAIPPKPLTASLNTIRKSFPSPAPTDSPARNGATGQSFFMPDISHLNDLVSGTLRLGSMKNGVPVFVKHGKVRDQAERQAPHDHAEVDELPIPEDEEKIFISMDMIREEIETLQQHDDIVQKYAESLQTEVDNLQSEVRRLKSRVSVDSAIGSRSGSEPETAAHEQLLAEKLSLETQVSSLQKRLHEASKHINHSEEDNITLSAERDRALKRLHDACGDIGDLMNKLDSREKELTDTQRKLDATLELQDTQAVNHHTGSSSKHELDALRLENKSLRADNNTLRREQLSLQEEMESLRADNNSLRREQESLVDENRSLRTNARSRMTDNEELRQGSSVVQQELVAAREEIEILQQDLETLEQERNSLKEDNDSLVRHNEKYFDDNKLLRRENSGFERSIHDLHDENMRLKEEVEFLKQQLDHCRPIGQGDGFIARLDQDEDEDEDDEDGEVEENMTSAFFVPDITIDENSAVVDPPSETNKGPPLDKATRSQRVVEIPDTTGPTEGSLGDVENTLDLRDDRAAEVKPSAQGRRKANQTKDAAGQQQKVAFSLPEPSQNVQIVTNLANKGSKRRGPANTTSRGIRAGIDADEDSLAMTTQEQELSLTMDLAKAKSHGKDAATKSRATGAGTATHHNLTNTSQTHKTNVSVKSSMKSTSHRAHHQRSATVDARSTCPSLSANARRVLDGLCEHNCQNCIVCSRITSHRGTVSAQESSSGKKKIQVAAPIPAPDQLLEQGTYHADEATIRPSQDPGEALAMVIKGLEDEAEHLKMELARLQARYAELNAAVGKRERRDVAAEVSRALRRLEVKRDQIYALYDVLEGQRAAGQAMTGEEVEMTIFSITGLTAREVSANFGVEGLVV